MTIHQVAAILNSVVEQATGNSGAVATDLSNLVALGDTILSSDVSRDKFLNALVDRIGRVVISSREYDGMKNTLKMDTFQFGAVLEKIYVAPPEAENAPQFDLTDGESVNQFIVRKPEAKMKLFSDRNVYEIDVTIPDYQLQSAFTSAAEMTAFIDAIFVAVENSKRMREDATTEITFATCIGENLHYAAQSEPAPTGVHVVNLLTDYNTKTGGSLTAEAAIRDFEFLQYATAQLQLWVKRLAKMSTQFNVAGYMRHTPPNLARLTVLQEFATNCEVYLRSSTYHDNLVTLPNYDEVAYWQGAGDFSFEKTSEIDITTASGNAVKQGGIVALLSDFEAMGIMIDSKRVRSVRNERGEYTNYFYKTDVRSFVDMSENSVVFVIANAP